MTPDYNYVYPVNADGACIALVPVELIWTEDFRYLNKSIPNYTDDWSALNALYGARPILRLRPHLSLCEYFTFGDNFPTEYVDTYKSIFTTRGMSPPMNGGEILEYRLNSHQIFTEKLAAPSEWMSFFAPDAVFDPNRNCFVLGSRLDQHQKAMTAASARAEA
jgi:hypothetical protein